MPERTNPFRNIRFVLRPGPRKLKVIFILLILISAIALGTLGLVRRQIQQRTQAVLDQAAILEQENDNLTERKENLGSSSSIKDIAREELDLVDPDTIIIEPNS